MADPTTLVTAFLLRPLEYGRPAPIRGVTTTRGWYIAPVRTPGVTPPVLDIAEVHLTASQDAGEQEVYAMLFTASPKLLVELTEAAEWMDELAATLRGLAGNVGAFSVNPTGVGMRQALRDEAARIAGRAIQIRQTILNAFGA